MKRFLSIMLVAVLLLSLFGCKKTPAQDATNTDTGATQNPETTTPESSFPTEPSIPDTTDPTAPSADSTEPAEPVATGATDPTFAATLAPTTASTDPTVPATPGATEPTVPATTGATKPTAPATTGATKPTAPATIPTTPTTGNGNETTAHTHTWSQWTKKEAASCIKTGTEERRCTGCGNLETRTVQKTGHTESDWIIDKPATQGATGVKHTVCTVCQQTIRTEAIPILSAGHTHKAAQALITKNATCTNSGTKDIVCSCGKLFETQTIPPIGHRYTESVVRPTPSTAGYTLHTCTGCGTTYKDTYTEFSNTATAELTYQSNGNGTCAVTGLSDTTVQYVIIPEKSPAGDTVVSIANEAFKANESLLFVDIADTVTNIGKQAFYQCKNLKTVDFPKTGTNPLVLGSNAFGACGIENADLSQTYMETVGDYAFNKCASLKTVKLKGVQSVGIYAFNSCSSLTSVIHTGELTSVGLRAFEHCRSLSVFRSQNGTRNLDTIMYLNDGAFSRTALRDIVFLKGFSRSGTPFAGCSNLGIVDCTQIGNMNVGFLGSTIEKIYLSQSMTEISTSFFEIVRIGEVIIPDSVTKIGREAFKGAHIGKVVFGSGLTTIDTNAFKGANIPIYDFSKVTKPLTIATGAFSDNTFTTFAFPDSTRSIGKGALKGCNNLQVLTIPFIAGTAEGSNSSKECFGWLFDDSVNGIDVWDQDNVVPASLKTLIFHGNDLGGKSLSGIALTEVVIGKQVTTIGVSNFSQNDSSLNRVYYEGTEEQWNSIVIKDDNAKLLAARKYFYSETQPATSDKYWHYDSTGNIVKW